MNAYTTKIKVDGKETKLSFRLTLKGQMALKEKYEESAVTTIMSSVDDAEKYATVLTEALNYKGNENTITDGEELYDILVDNGYAGTEDFMRLGVEIGVASGLLSKAQGEKIVKMAAGIIDDALDEAEPEAKAKN